MDGGNPVMTLPFRIQTPCPNRRLLDSSNIRTSKESTFRNPVVRLDSYSFPMATSDFVGPLRRRRVTSGVTSPFQNQIQHSTATRPRRVNRLGVEIHAPLTVWANVVGFDLTLADPLAVGRETALASVNSSATDEEDRVVANDGTKGMTPRLPIIETMTSSSLVSKSPSLTRDRIRSLT